MTVVISYRYCMYSVGSTWYVPCKVYVVGPVSGGRFSSREDGRLNVILRVSRRVSRDVLIDYF